VRWFTAKAVADAGHQINEVIGGGAVVAESTLAFGKQKSASLHKPQMGGHHGRREFADFGKFADGGAPRQNSFNNAQSDRVRENAKAFSSFFKRLPRYGLSGVHNNLIGFIPSKL